MIRIAKTAVLFFSAFFLSLYSAFAAGAATKQNTDKYYEVKSLRLTYDSNTGQIKALWNQTQKSTNVIVTLYLGDTELETVTVSGTSVDFTEDVTEHGIGTYRCKAYPEKLGDEKKVASKELVITEVKLKKAEDFDPSIYTFEDASLFYDEAGAAVYGKWTFSDRHSAAKVQLFKGTTAVSEWLSTSELSYDFSSLVAKKGAGTYILKVYPGRLGDTYLVESEEFDVSSEAAKAVKARITAEEKAEEAKRVGWYHDTQAGVWKYYQQPGVLLKKEWLEYNGAKYHFSSSGIMQIGWQVIDDKYYYFDATGALVTNAVVNGEYQVNAAGERVDATGAVVSAEGEKEAKAVPVTLTTATISVSESGKEAGVVKQASFKAGTGFQIDSIVYSSEYPDWKAGSAVKVTVQVSTLTNYTFGNGIKFSVRGCKNVSSTGTSKSRTVTFNYYPKKQLEAPDFVYLNTETELCWKKVTDASRYRVIVTTDGTNVLTEIITTNQTSLQDYVDLEDDQVTTTVKIYAMASTGKASYYTTSQAFTIENLYEYAKANTIEGELKFSASGLRYYDESGEKVTGWKQLFGYWYYFKKNGLAAGPGWLKEENGLWYYFDEAYHMCTGTIHDGTGEYFLNDGSVSDLPLGAWVQK